MREWDCRLLSVRRTFVRRALKRSGGIEVLLRNGVGVGRPLVDLHRDLIVALVGTDQHVAHCDCWFGHGLRVSAAGSGRFPVCERLHVESGLELLRQRMILRGNQIGEGLEV